MRRIRSLLLTTEMQIGGVQYQLIEIARRLDKGEFDVHLAFNGRGALADTCSELDGVSVHTVARLGRSPNPLTDLAALWDLVRLFRRLRPDVVNYTGPKAALLGAIAAWLTRIPGRIYTMGGVTFNERQPWPVRKALIWMERSICFCSTVVVNVSRINREKVLAHRVAPARKLQVIYSGYDLERYVDARKQDRAALRARFGWADDRFVVLQPNNLKPGKNNIALLQSAVEVVRACPQVRFVIVGDGPDRARLEQFVVDNDLAEHCELLGWRSDLPDLLYAADVVTLTTRYAEGLPHVCSQAMAAGRPLVMYDNEGIREELTHGENGFLVEIDDVSGFARRLVELAGDHELTRRMGQRSLELLSHEHDADVLARRTAEAYREQQRANA